MRLDIDPTFPNTLLVTDLTIIVDTLLHNAITILQGIKEPYFEKSFIFSWKLTSPYLTIKIIYVYNNKPKRNPFYFLPYHQQTVQKIKLGISAVQDIVQQNHGSITLQNKQQSFSVIIQLPCTK